ncbi:glycosyltransferase [Myxococcota bacterium]|nr:glycosyltransferase [Myxococcota bacterium]
MRDGADTLRAAVDSALAQCHAGDQVVVVDDGSRDDPARVLPADRRLLLLRQPPLGIAAALEHGRAACQGELIARLDADDVALPGRIDAQRRALAADPELAGVGGQALLHRAGGVAPEGMARYVAWVNGLHSRVQLAQALLVESPLFHPAATLRADALAQVDGWRPGDLPEDYDLWLRLHRAGFGMANVPQPVVRIEDRPTRLTRTDPRYRRAAFTRLKQEHLDGAPPRIAVWGAGRTGRPWLSWAAARGALVAVVDAFAAGWRQGLPILPPGGLVGRQVDLLLVAVGARGAREEIAAALADLRPDLPPGPRPGPCWIAVA